MAKQIPIEVTQGFADPSEQGGPPGYAPDDKPVEERGGVPYDVWKLNQGSEGVIEAKSKGDQRKAADPGSQPDVPDNYTELEQKKADLLGR